MDADDSSLIEGIGDEVVILLGTVLAAFVAIAAWLSTRPPPPREPPRFVVRRPHRHVLEFYAPVSPETRTPPVYPSGQAVTEALIADSAAAPSSTSSSEAVAVCSSEVTAVCSSEVTAVSNMEEEEEEEIIDEVKEESCEEQQNIVDEMEVEEEDSSAADTIRLKFVDDTIRCIATCCETTTVGSLKERLFAVELSAGRVIRLIFAGQLLRDDSQTLQSYGVADGSVIHCHVGQQRQQQQQQQQTSTPQSSSTSAAQQPRLVHEREMDELQLGVNLSSHSLLIFGFVFGLIWFCALRYPEFFDFTALFTLSISSVIYCAFTYGVLRQRRNTVRRNT